ncbi:DUF4249 domain-containing protein [Flagellimonas sp. 389]|uniref:DUF4249 domain-containing protein n=1 Tax=Flagellimonas sp. 389 TaxID=2835862 RepID=UPI001BD40B9C|nr:DUF4249 domain-containing protein [Flagellimonas sp. 389]MBS9463464.1 DUF4249 domain-containing protein [Flagellimonas sp. 389]
MTLNLRIENNILTIVVPLLYILGCTEPFTAPTEDFENILVIDALITTEDKFQEINLSRTFLFDAELEAEREAVVQIVGNDNSTYSFTEREPGQYFSDTSFGAVPGVLYSLSVITQQGDSFIGGPISIEQEAELEEIRAVRTTTEEGEEGIAIVADGFDPTGEAIFYRYDYVETFKIVSVANPQFDLIVASENPPLLEKVPKTRQENICYRTQFSNSILLTTSENLTESRIENFQVRFIPKTAFELRTRYSILVNQYIQSRTAQSFYEDLRDFSNVLTVFAQTQPGFIIGNIVSDNESDTRVLGLFEVSQLSSKRIFFEYDDFFFDNSPPRFIRDCPVVQGGSRDPVLFDLIKRKTHKYRGDGDPSGFVASPIGCIDCTVYGSNVKPDFWED